MVDRVLQGRRNYTYISLNWIQACRSHQAPMSIQYIYILGTSPLVLRTQVQEQPCHSPARHRVVFDRQTIRAFTVQRSKPASGCLHRDMNPPVYKILHIDTKAVIVAMYVTGSSATSSQHLLIDRLSPISHEDAPGASLFSHAVLQQIVVARPQHTTME